MDEELSNVVLTLIYNENLLETMLKVIENYRNIRLNMGKTFRVIQKNFNNDLLEQSRTTFLESFNKNIEKINETEILFKSMMLDTQASVSELYVEFDSMQKKFLKLKQADIMYIYETNEVD